MCRRDGCDRWRATAWCAQRESHRLAMSVSPALRHSVAPTAVAEVVAQADSLVADFEARVPADSQQANRRHKDFASGRGQVRQQSWSPKEERQMTLRSPWPFSHRLLFLRHLTILLLRMIRG